MSQALLSVRRLCVEYDTRVGWRGVRQTIRAVDGVDFDLHAGQTLGIAGESGCGKSTLARAVVGLQPVTSGSIRLEGQELARLDGAGWLKLRRRVQFVFQDPFASLDPRMTVGESVAEPLVNLHPEMSRKDRRQRISETLDKVGLPGQLLGRYPHEFSSGQCQRIGIARALVVRPDLLICDEPVSALDVSIQAQIVNLLQELQRDLNLAMIFISHNLSIVRVVSHRVLVMYLGKIMEHAACEALFARAAHPYTRALLSAVPVPDPQRERTRRRIALRGDLPSPAFPPSGCVFRSRCPWVMELCARQTPALRRIGPTHAAACHFAGDSSGAPLGLEQSFE